MATDPQMPRTMPDPMPLSRADDRAPGSADVAGSLRRAMRRTAQPITILTARDRQDVPHGIAASAVISISMDPPSMGVSVNRLASIYRVLDDTRAFCINVLHVDQSDLVETFSRSDQRERRFLSTDWARGPLNLPYLRSAQAAIFCTSDRQIDYATHTLHIGSVMNVMTSDDRLPLLWFDGSYAAVAAR